MTNFNFLRGPAPMWVRGLQGVRIPEHLMRGLLAVAVSLTVAGGGMVIERYRLRSAQARQAAYRDRFERSTTTLARARLDYDQVRGLLTLQQKLTKVSESGDVQALRLAGIAHAVPPHAWLTSLRERDGAVALEGGAASLARIADVLRGLTTVRAGSATLTGVRSGAYGGSAFQYGIVMEPQKP